jgi:putative membrane protein
MTVHMSVVAVAAPLLAFGVAGGPWDRRLEVHFFSPLLASLVELAVLWIWHTPALHRAARQNSTAFAAEQASFLVSGLFLWIAVLGGAPPDCANRNGAGIVALLLTAMHMTLLGALIALSPRRLYAHMQWLFRTFSARRPALGRSDHADRRRCFLSCRRPLADRWLATPASYLNAAAPASATA